MTTTLEQDHAQNSGGFARARKAMIDSQLRTSGLSQPFVLEAMYRVPREDFVPESARASAYIDRAVRLANGRYLAAPVFYGAVLAEAKPRVEDKVLIVDAGSGYLPALLEPVVAEVTVISPEDAAKASRKGGEHTLLLIDGAIESFPAALAKRLAPEARIVTGRVERGVQRLAAGQLIDGEPRFVNRMEMGIPVLREFAAAKAWSF